MLTLIFSLCVQSSKFHQWLPDPDHAPSYVLKHNGEERGPWSEELRNLRYLGKNVINWYQLFYHSISVTNGISWLELIESQA